MKSKFIISILLLIWSITLIGQDFKKVFYLDTTYVDKYVVSQYIGCMSKVSDTIYSLRSELKEQGNWRVYYDHQLSIKQSEFYLQNDTSYSIQYYRNGQKKKEDRSYRYLWIYHATWCENGQVIIPAQNPGDKSYQTYTSYYCNGNKEWQYNACDGRLYGVYKKWYENGQIQTEQKYTEYNHALSAEDQPESVMISQLFWDEAGNTIEPFDTWRHGINDFGAPIFISQDSFDNAIPYYNITDQVGYDNQMNLLSDLIYKKTKLNKKCNCKVGQVYVSFYVERNGKITNVQIDQSLEESVDEAFIEAIQNIRKWHKAKFNGESTRVIVKMALKLENVK